MRNIISSTGLRDMGIGKKLVFSGYMFIMPVIICISIITSIYDYRESVGYKKEKSLQSTGFRSVKILSAERQGGISLRLKTKEIFRIILHFRGIRSEDRITLFV